MRCSACGSANPAGMRFCGSCGAALALACPRCGETMPGTFRFCGSCGARLGGSEPVIATGTKQVTVLFADISGFTQLAERLAPGELQENMRTAWDAIASEIRTAGGLIEKYIGDAVVAVFGAQEVQEDHPRRAQAAALATLAALERTNARIAERTGRKLALRVGINSGMAATGAIGDSESEFGVLGDAVNVAARLEQAAEPGEILVGDATYRLTPDAFSYEPHPPIVARGKSVPLVAWRLIGRPSTRRAITTATLVGREPALAILRTALDDALTGRSRVVSVVGEPGLGRSRLLDEVLADPRTRGALVARARGTLTDAHRPYGPLTDLARRLLAIGAHTPVELAHRTVAETVPDMQPDARALLLGALGYDIAPATLAGATRRRLIDGAIRDLFLAVARSQGLVAVIDDLHLADAATLGFLDGFVPSLGDSRVLLVTAYRPDLVPSWTTAGAHVQVRLVPLDDAASRALIAAAVPGGIPAPVEDAIARSAAGNPVHLLEAIALVRRSGTLVERDSGALADVARLPELPASLPQLLLRRLDGLSENGRRVLNAASLFERSFESALVAAVFGPDVDADAELLALVEVGILAEEDRGRYRFRHGFLREIVYGALLGRVREELHGRIALAIESRLPDVAAREPEVLAHHFGLSARAPRALEYSVRSAARAHALHDLIDALHHHRQAAAHASRAGDGTGHASALLASADVEAELGDAAAALATVETALANEPPVGLRGALRRRAGRLAAEQGAVQAAAEHLADAERWTAETGVERAELTLAKAFLAAADDRPAEAMAVARAAAREAAQAADGAAELRAEEATVRFALAAAAHDAARTALERCTDLAARIGDIAALARALGAQLAAALDRSDAVEAERIALELLGDRSRGGDAATEASALRGLARAQLIAGRPDDAERALHRALAIAEPLRRDAPHPAEPALTLELLGTSALARGDAAAARSHLEEAVILAERSPDRAHLVTRARAGLAAAALASGDQGAARQHAAAASAAEREHSCRRCAAQIAASLVRVAAASGDIEAAHEARAHGLEAAVRLGLQTTIDEIRRMDAELAAREPGAESA